MTKLLTKEKAKRFIKNYIQIVKFFIMFAILAYTFVIWVGMEECNKISRLNKLEFTFTWYYKNMCYFDRDGIKTTLAQEQDMLKEKK